MKKPSKARLKVCSTLRLGEYLKNNGMLEKRAYSALLGSINYSEKRYMVLVNEVKLRHNINGHDIFEVHSITAICISTFEENTKLSRFLTKYFHSGFLFSFSLNLTQRITCTEKKRERPNYNFWWNRSMFQDFESNLKKDWIIYLTCVYLKN